MLLELMKMHFQKMICFLVLTAMVGSSPPDDYKQYEFEDSTELPLEKFKQTPIAQSGWSGVPSTITHMEQKQTVTLLPVSQNDWPGKPSTITRKEYKQTVMLTPISQDYWPGKPSTITRMEEKQTVMLTPVSQNDWSVEPSEITPMAHVEQTVSLTQAVTSYETKDPSTTPHLELSQTPIFPCEDGTNYAFPNPFLKYVSQTATLTSDSHCKDDKSRDPFPDHSLLDEQSFTTVTPPQVQYMDDGFRDPFPDQPLDRLFPTFTLSNFEDEDAEFMKLVANNPTKMLFRIATSILDYSDIVSRYNIPNQPLDDFFTTETVDPITITVPAFETREHNQ